MPKHTNQLGFAHIIIPVIVILVLVAVTAATIFWRNSQNKSTRTTSTITQTTPLPTPNTEENTTAIVLTAPSPSVKPTVSPSATPTSNYEKRISNLEDTVFDLQNRLSTVEKASPSPIAIGSQSSLTKYPIYLYFGASTSGNTLDWTTSSYPQLEIDTADYVGYANMQLEVTLKLFQGNGTAYVRLYNSTDGINIASSDISTSSEEYTSVISSKFGITSGKKVYKLQIKSLTGYSVEVLSARIRINF